MNKMKKLLLSIFATGLLLSANAQIPESRISKLSGTHNQFVEQTRDVILTPRQAVNTLPGSKTNKRVHKANYQYWGQVSNIEFAVYNLGGHPGFQPISGGSSRHISGYSDLFPDSLLASYEYNIATSATWTVYKDQPFASTGFVFDPYSLSFDNFGLKGLFRDAEGVGYGYRLDTLTTYVDYRLPHGYNPNSPDTLRFYISSHNFYNVDSIGKRREGLWSTIM
jgi:hypothetical protein